MGISVAGAGPAVTPGAVSAIVITYAGFYTVCPTGVAISGGGGSSAAATVTCGSQGIYYWVRTVTVTAGGSGFTSIPTVAFTGGTGTAATARAQVNTTLDTALVTTVSACGTSTLGAACTSTTFTLANTASTMVSGATVNHDDGYAIQEALTACQSTGVPVHLPAGQYRVELRTLMMATAPCKFYGDGEYATAIYDYNSQQDLFRVSYNAANPPLLAGALFEDFAVLGSGTASSGYAFNTGSGNSYYMSNLVINRVAIVSTWGGLYIGSFQISNWYEDLYIQNTLAEGIYYNALSASGDNNITNDNLAGINTGIVINASDVTTFSNLKLNGAGVVFTTANSDLGDRFSNINIEGNTPALACAFDFGPGSNVTNASISGGQIDMAQYAYCSAPATLTATAFLYNVNDSPLPDLFNGTLLPNTGISVQRAMPVYSASVSGITLGVSSGTPEDNIYNSSAGSNAKIWQWNVDSSGYLNLSALQDSQVAAYSPAIVITRTGADPTSITFGEPITASTFSGAISVAPTGVAAIASMTTVSQSANNPQAIFLAGNTTSDAYVQFDFADSKSANGTQIPALILISTDKTIGDANAQQAFLVVGTSHVNLFTTKADVASTSADDIQLIPGNTNVALDCLATNSQCTFNYMLTVANLTNSGLTGSKLPVCETSGVEYAGTNTSGVLACP